MGNTRGGDARDYIGARLRRLASNPEKSGSIGSRPCPARLRTEEGDGSADMRPQGVSEQRRGGGARPGSWASAVFQGLSLFFLFLISFLFCFIFFFKVFFSERILRTIKYKPNTINTK